VAVRWYLTYPLKLLSGLRHAARSGRVSGSEHRHALGSALCDGVREGLAGYEKAVALSWRVDETY
jgi:hypothetical protein